VGSQASLDQEWKFVASRTNGHSIIEGAAGGTYLSIDGEPKEGALVIHSSERMDWNVEYLGNAIRWVPSRLPTSRSEMACDQSISSWYRLLRGTRGNHISGL
jgi:hypothetical protein